MSQHLDDFSSNWISSPGATITDLLLEREYTIAHFAEDVHRTPYDVAQLLTGAARLTPDWANQLAEILGSTSDFWLRREQQYRSDIARLSATTESSQFRRWLAELPVKDMIKNRWIEAAENVEEQAQIALAFFGVPSIDSWRSAYSKPLQIAAYRTSTAHEIHPGAETTWIRQGEIQACAIDCAPWNKALLGNSLPAIRELSRIPDPVVFLPKLTAICAAAGVAVIVAKAPKGCRSSGATKFLTDEKALLLLSFRFLNDDQFWFTVFHEAAHLILHTECGLFLEGNAAESTVAESEADDFASAQLFGEDQTEVTDLPVNRFAIARYARRRRISPGLVVGQLQKLGRIPYKHFNYMKVRYKWSTSLS
jgi:HTH-type transcriptional regulator / antitoxin HigA